MTMDYSDIIDHPHHVSQKHPQMSLQKRAEQFAPFAALTGYEEYIKRMESENESMYEHQNIEDTDYYLPDEFD